MMARAMLVPLLVWGLLGSAAAQTAAPASAALPAAPASAITTPESTATAATATATATATERLLFLGVRDDQGKRDSHLTAAVDARLAGRVRLAEPPKQAAVAPKLNEVEQLLVLGQLAGAALVLVVDARPAPGQGYDFMIQLFQVQTLQAFTEQTRCSDCSSPTQPPTQLLAIIDQLLAKHPEVLLPQPVAPPAADLSAARPQQHRYLAAGLLGGVAVAALTTAVALTVLSLNPGSRQYTGNICFGPDGQPAECFRNYLPGYATAYAVAGLATVGLVLTLTVPRARPKTTAPPKVASRLSALSF